MRPTNFTSDFNRPPSTARVGWWKTAALTALIALPATVTLPLLQAVSVRFVTPRFTLTMAERSRSAVQEGGSPRIRVSPITWTDAPHVARAVVASEDGRFFLHQGIDRRGVCSAWKNNRAGGRLRGGSSITQQVARNVFLWQGRSWVRKGLEVGYTGLLELVVGKDRILDLYLSVAETGPMVFGVQEGAQHAFQRDADALTRSQSARIAWLLPSPNRRTVADPGAAAKARWVHENPGVFPDHRSFDELQTQARSTPWWPLCP